MLKPTNLRRVFFGLLGLGVLRAINSLTMFFALSDSSVFVIGVPQLFKNVLLGISPAALTYILYWFARRKYGEEPEKTAPKPEEENENLIPEEKLKRIIYLVIFVVSILMLLKVIFF